MQSCRPITSRLSISSQLCAVVSAPSLPSPLIHNISRFASLPGQPPAQRSQAQWTPPAPTRRPPGAGAGLPTPKFESSFQTIGRYYTRNHEWLQVDDEDGIGTIGITQVAQRALGEVVFCRLPAEGDRFDVMDTIVTLEAIKTVGEVKSPVAGEVIEVNPRLSAEPALVSVAPLTDGWLVRLNFGGKLPRYLLKSKAVIRAEVAPLLANLEGLQDFLAHRLGDPAVSVDEEQGSRRGVDASNTDLVASTAETYEELTFTGLNSQERLWLHKAAQNFGFSSSSRGSGAGRQLVVKRMPIESGSALPNERIAHSLAPHEFENDAVSRRGTDEVAGRGRRSSWPSH